MRRLLLVAVVSVSLTACWQQAGFDSGGSRFSPLPAGVGVANVGSLTHAFTYPVKGANAMVVSDGKAFVAGDHLTAFDAAGSSGCSGAAPAVCAPVWTSAAAGAYSSVVVGGGRVWTAFTDAATGAGKVVGFDPAGVAGCSGSPVVCSPLVTIAVSRADHLRWSSDALHLSALVGSRSFSVVHQAYRADGSLLWTAVVGGIAYPVVPDSVVDGDVVVAANGAASAPVAFDARGLTNCSGSPNVCTAMWTYDANASVLAARDGHLYAEHAGHLAVYDIHGNDGCYGAPKVCYPLWQTSGPVGRPVVTDDHLFVSYGGSTAVYPLDLSTCTGAIRTCDASWTESPLTGSFAETADAVGGGVYFATRKTCTSIDCSPGTVSWQLEAFDAHGVAGCAPGPCRELLSTDTPVPMDEVEIVGSVVFARPLVNSNFSTAEIWAYRPPA